MIRFKNMLKILTIVLILAGNSYAQQEIDNCFNYLKAGAYQRAIEAGKRAVRLYPRSVNAHFCLGDVYRLVGEFDLALSSMKEAERLAARKDYLMYIFSRLGYIYYGKGDLDNALLYHNRYLSLAKDLGDRQEEASALNNIALIFDGKGELDKALSYYEESLRLKTNEAEKSPTYSNIAMIYAKKGEHQKAISYLKKSIDIDERYGNYHGLAIKMLNLGDTYREAKDFIKAEEYLNEGLKRILKIADKYWEAAAYKYLGRLYRDKGEIQEAKDYLTKAYNLYNSIGAKNGAQDALFSLMEIEKNSEGAKNDGERFKTK